MKILEYHEIVTGSPQEVHAVNAFRFTAQMAWLRENGYQVVRLSDYVEWLLSGHPLTGHNFTNSRFTAVTFDDGYQDNFQNALPVLQQYSYPATIFLATGQLEKTSAWRQEELGQVAMLTWDQILEMSQLGIEFGSHSVSHVDLTRLDAVGVEKELCQSRQEIESRLGQPVKLFSYPYSQTNPAIKRMVKRLGYQAACTYQPFYVGPAGRELFNLQRIGILAHDDVSDFAEKISGSLPRRLQWTRYQVRNTIFGRLGISAK